METGSKWGKKLYKVHEKGNYMGVALESIESTLALMTQKTSLEAPKALSR